MATKKKRNTPKAKPHPISGLTEAQTKARLKAAIRREWRRTSRYKHIKSVRYINEDPNCNSRYALSCAICSSQFGQSEKVSYRAKSGKMRRASAYHVDHICDGMPPINDIAADLGAYALAMLETDVRVLCVACHAEVTAAQTKLRHASK